MTTRAISSPANRVIPYEVITDISARIRRTIRARRPSHDSVDSVRTAESDSDGSGSSQVESKASDSVRIAEPVATREVYQESCKIADDMIEGVSSRSVAISARSEGEDITTRAISSPAVPMIPHDVVNDASDRMQRTVRSRSHSHDSVRLGGSRAFRLHLPVATI